MMLGSGLLQSDLTTETISSLIVSKASEFFELLVADFMVLLTFLLSSLRIAFATSCVSFLNSFFSFLEILISPF